MFKTIVVVLAVIGALMLFSLLFTVLTSVLWLVAVGAIAVVLVRMWSLLKRR